MAGDLPKQPSGGDLRGDSASSADRERDLLIAATAKVAAEYGYDALTVELVVRSAGLAEAAFGEHFDDLRASLLAALDRFIERLWVRVVDACDDQRDWPAQVNAALRAVLGFLTDAPAHARVFVVQVAAAGPAAAQRHLALIERLASRLREGRTHFPAASSLPRSTEQALIGGIAAIVSSHLLAEETDLLPALEPEFIELLLAPYVGRPEARRLAQT